MNDKPTAEQLQGLLNGLHVITTSDKARIDAIMKCVEVLMAIAIEEAKNS